MQLDDLNLKTHGGKTLRDLIDRAIRICFFPPPGSKHHKLICFDRFHGHNNKNKK